MTALPAEEKRLLLRRVQQAAEAQDFGRAIALARQALESGIEEAMLLNLRAYWHEIEGRDAESLADLQWAQRLAPGEVPVLNALGLAYARLGRMREAIQSFDSVIVRMPDFAPAHFNKGWTSEDIGELDTARECYERAGELTPMAPDPAARLAALAARLGEWEAARANATRALAIAPRHPLAIVALARVEVADRDLAAAERRLRAMLEHAELSPADRTLAQSVLGDLLDADGRCAEAFAIYAERNRILRSMHQARFEGPGVETMPHYVGWFRAYFENSVQPWTQPPSEITKANGPQRHVFILGFARSGTTLLEEVLATDPSVVTTQERDALSDGVREFLTTPDGLERLSTLPRAAARRMREQYWRRIQEFGIEAKDRTLVDKQPFNTMKLPLIARLFPASKILFSVRDPRDVILSCFRHQFRMNSSTFEFLTLEGTARLYDAMMQLSDILRARLGLDVLQLRHEDLVADFDGQMRAVCAFIGMPWSDTMRDFAAQSGRRAVATPSSVQIKRGLNQAGIGQWRHYRAELEPIFPILKPWVDRFGYPAE